MCACTAAVRISSTVSDGKMLAIWNARTTPSLPRAMTSNQSVAQLKAPTSCGHEKVATSRSSSILYGLPRDARK